MNLDPTNLSLLATKNNQYCQVNCNLFLLNKERVFERRIPKTKIPLVGNETVVNNNASSGVLIVAFALITTILFQLVKIKIKTKEYAEDNFASDRDGLVKDILIPCKNCTFYDSNSYLECAVNPTKVLKPEAKECADYSFNSED